MAEKYIYPHDSESIYNVVNETAKAPPYVILSINNDGPAKLVRVTYLTATRSGAFNIVKEQDIVIDKTGRETKFDIPQTAVERGRIVVYNDTDVDAAVSCNFLSN